VCIPKPQIRNCADNYDYQTKQRIQKAIGQIRKYGEQAKHEARSADPRPDLRRLSLGFHTSRDRRRKPFLALICLITSINSNQATHLARISNAIAKCYEDNTQRKECGHPEPVNRTVELHCISILIQSFHLCQAADTITASIPRPPFDTSG
jgi:hypothetical protein